MTHASSHKRRVSKTFVVEEWQHNFVTGKTLFMKHLSSSLLIFKINTDLKWIIKSLNKSYCYLLNNSINSIQPAIKSVDQQNICQSIQP